MIDFVFAVENSKDWHAQNMERNPSHYSGLQFLGSNMVAAFQEKLGAGVYYNTLVKCEKRVCTVEMCCVAHCVVLLDIFVGTWPNKSLFYKPFRS